MRDFFLNKDRLVKGLEGTIYFIVAVLFLSFLMDTHLMGEKLKVCISWGVAVLLPSVIKLIVDYIVYGW